MTSSHGSADEPIGVDQPVPGVGRRRFTEAIRQELATLAIGTFPGVEGGVFRKRARLCAVRQDEAFEVETENGVMTGRAGDWLATNHPDDDLTSDVWVISAERFAATYEPATGEFEEV